jgi:hypothetical protein
LLIERGISLEADSAKDIDVSEFMKNVLERFEALVREQDLPYSVVSIARQFVIQDIVDFEDRERSYGIGKTRRPQMGRQYFESQIARANEVKRREREETKWLFGEDD